MTKKSGVMKSQKLVKWMESVSRHTLERDTILQADFPH